MFSLHQYQLRCACCFALVAVVLAVVSFSVSAFYENPQHYLIKINIPSRSLELYFRERLLRIYPVGVGANRKQATPVGSYSVQEKVLSPVWQHPFKEEGEGQIAANANNNPLGKHWIGFHKGEQGRYGIHGTNNPDSVGKFVSHGCVRMHNEHIAELFELVPFFTPVLVTYERIVFTEEGRQIYAKIYSDPYNQNKLSSEQIIQELQDVYPDYELEILLETVRQAAQNNGNPPKKYLIAHILF